MVRLASGFFALTLLTLACSSTNGGASDGSSGNGGSGGSSGSSGTGGNAGKFSCCLNDVFYQCPDQAAFDKCAGASPLDCHAKCGGADFECHMKCDDEAANVSHDPSACAKKTEACPPISGPSASCNGIGSGKCDVDGDCGSGNHCTGGKCFDNTAGSKCDVDGDCGSGNHCTGGCCLDNSAGSKCDVDGDCGSGGSCTSGTCN